MGFVRNLITRLLRWGASLEELEMLGALAQAGLGPSARSLRGKI